MRLIDLPGIYSLTSYSMEEMVSRKVILGGEVDVIVNVVDASAWRGTCTSRCSFWSLANR